MINTVHQVSVEEVLSIVKANTIAYSHFVKHAPQMLRQSMMLAYQTAVDETLKAMDAARTIDPFKHDQAPKVVLLDANGNAT